MQLLFTNLGYLGIDDGKTAKKNLVNFIINFFEE